MASKTHGQSKTALMKRCGEMWSRNTKNIADVPTNKEGGQGVYILYDGSTPVYVGKGNIQARLRKANDKSKRRGNSWDYFSWYILKDRHLVHDVEVLLLRILPPYLRYMTRQGGNFKGRISSTGQKPKNSTPIYIERTR
jgi:hypothetical protein